MLSSESGAKVSRATLGLIKPHERTYSGRRVTKTSRGRLAPLQTILPSISSETLSIQCRSSTIIVTGDIPHRAAKRF